ncbi:VOC family protein [Lentilitoribacter sp. Alg239-R112]|jgi:PhnB protein|uniref:VOC family protein n=1 Tax=Lentilitoribacter sp. Alg239-R112 TaxID=2305987 RepID=UPI0013A6BE77|nr:VOC family protein [Lentilitoribacter sp. Alg239-R112]
MRTGYQRITPYLICRDASRAIDFYEKHFNAQEIYRLESPDGKIMHSELDFQNCRIMISDEFEQMGIKSPLSYDGTPVSINIYVDDIDTTFNNMISDGCKTLTQIENQFHGDRSGKLQDPFGHIWHIASNLEDVGTEEIKRRFNEMMKG